MKWKAWSKKRKILFVGVLAAVVVLAAGTAVWLLWGQEKPPQRYLLDISAYANGSQTVYVVQNGLQEQSIPLARYSISHVPEGFHQLYDSAPVANRYSLRYTDAFYNQSGTAVTLYQIPALQNEQVWFPEPVDQVEFAGIEVWYASASEQTTAAWLCGDTLFTLNAEPSLSMEEMLEWVNGVDYSAAQMPQVRPLEFVEGGDIVFQRNGMDQYISRPWQIGGDPDLPQQLDHYRFTQTPEGFTPAEGEVSQQYWPLDFLQPEGVDTGTRKDWLQSYSNQEGDSLTLVNCILDRENNYIFQQNYAPQTESTDGAGGSYFGVSPQPQDVETVTVNGMEGRLYSGAGYSELVLLGDAVYLDVIYVGDISARDFLELAQGIGR